MNGPDPPSRVPWLLLIHQLPAKPAYARVKVWRRLQALGAVTVKNAVYALPCNEETQEDFAWLAREIRELGGEAVVSEAQLTDGLSDEELREHLARSHELVATGLSRKLRREFITVKTPFGEVTVKLGKLNGQIVQAAPEFESCRQVAAQAGVALKEVYDAALRQAR